MKSSSSKITLKQPSEDLNEIEYTEVNAYSGSKKKSLAEKRSNYSATKCTATLIES